ncbi:hypothetical protein JY96_00300 [Aquabacterium sp. NJ1]|nr:hypothetical protein JY96_00300 [Aquabacterium sp. NJ1]
MCMGYAKDIAIWACETELKRRQDALILWGEALLERNIDGDGPDAQSRHTPSSKEADHGLKVNKTVAMA